MEKDILNPKEAAEYLKISLPTFYKLIREGLPAIRIGRQWRIQKSTLDTWMQHESLQGISEAEGQK